MSVETFQELVPVHDYNKIYNRWWKKTLDGVPDVTLAEEDQILCSEFGYLRSCQ